MVSSIDGQVQIETKGTMDWNGGFGMPSGRPRIGSVSWDNVRQTWLVKEKCEAGAEKVYLYQEDGKFTEA